MSHRSKQTVYNSKDKKLRKCNKKLREILNLEIKETLSQAEIKKVKKKAFYQQKIRELQKNKTITTSFPKDKLRKFSQKKRRENPSPTFEECFQKYSKMWDDFEKFKKENKELIEKQQKKKKIFKKNRKKAVRLISTYKNNKFCTKKDWMELMMKLPKDYC